MNAKQKPKHPFARQWLEDVLIYCRGIKGFLLHLRTIGRLNERYTSLNDDMMLDAETLLRIWVNLGMVVDEEDFDEEWKKWGIKIRQFARKHGREYNQMYERKKKQNER